MKTTYLILALISGSSLLSAQVHIASKYKIVNKFRLEGDEKWDYLFSDDASSRTYVSHGSMVQVIDQEKGKEIGRITGLMGVHGIAIAPAFNKGFISTKNDNMITVFNTTTFEVIAKKDAGGKSPDAILFDSFSKKVFVGNAHSNDIAVMSPESNEIVAHIALQGNPEFIVTDGKGAIYVNLESSSSVTKINATSYKVEKTWPLAPGEEPTGLAIDNESHRLFSACSNKLMVVVDIENGKVIATLPIGEKTDGAAFDPGLKRAYSSNAVGTVTVVQENADNTFSVLENVTTQLGGKTVAINKITHHIYVPSADFETVGGKQKVKPGTFVVLDIAPQ